MHLLWRQKFQKFVLIYDTGRSTCIMYMTPNLQNVPDKTSNQIRNCAQSLETYLVWPIITSDCSLAYTFKICQLLWANRQAQESKCSRFHNVFGVLAQPRRRILDPPLLLVLTVAMQKKFLQKFEKLNFTPSINYLQKHCVCLRLEQLRHDFWNNILSLYHLADNWVRWIDLFKTIRALW